MSAEHSESQLARLNALSDRVFGEAGEIDAAEAEVLLQAAGIDPARLKSDLYERFKERSSTYAASGKPLPPRLRQALRDLEPSAQASSEESLLIRAGKLRVRRLLTEIKNLPLVLELEGTPAFTAAYRNRRELTARDKQVLDGIADELKAGPKATQSKQFSRQEPNGERPGAIYARILLKELGARHGAVQEVAAALGLKLREVESDGFDGALIRAQNAPLGTIVVRASIREKSRKNFTIAHEIGHFVLPGHERGSVACTASEVGEWTDAPDGRDFEREANQFAAELLMPRERVEVIAGGAPPSLEVMEKIARELAVSLSAAAWRYCDVAREPCAVVWSLDGVVHWAKRSEGFPYFLPKGQPLAEGTFAAACFTQEKAPGRPRAVPAHLWIASSGADATVRIFEQSKSLPSYQSVITLLWIREDAEADR